MPDEQFMRWIEPISSKVFWRTGAMGASIAAVVGLCFLIYPIGNRLRHLSYDVPFWLRGSTSVPTDAVIVFMDTDSAKAFGQTPGVPWDPKIHTRLVRHLKTKKPKAIVFDALFNSTNEFKLSAYQDLADAIKDFGKVVVAASSEDPVTEGELKRDQPDLPVRAICEVAPWGIVEFPQSSDGAIRQQRFIRGWTNMAWAAADLIGKAPPSGTANPIRWINYYGPSYQIESVSYKRVFETNAFPDDYFDGKVVFVGKKSMIGPEAKTKDAFPTPTAENMPGVEIQATAFLNLIHNEWINDFSPLTEFLVTLLIASVFGFGCIVLRPWIAAAVSVVSFICLAALGVYLAWHFRVWFPWMIPGVVQIPAAVVWAALLNTRKVYHEKELLEQTLATARAASASAAAGSGTGSGPIAALNKINQAAAPNSDVPTLAVMDAPTQLEHIIGDHELIRSIGQGAYGEVWLGKSLVGIYRAVKVVYRRNFQHAAPFEREFRGLKKFAPVSMSYTGFVQILHVGKNDAEGYFYYIMELGDDELTGQQIRPETYSAKNLGKELKKSGGLPVADCLAVGVQLSAALEHLHKRELIHRDIKPSNIIFVHGVPKLADIGLVTALEVNNSDATYVGTPGYIAPEGPGSRAADIFSLGKVLYECSMGRDCQQYPELPSSLLDRPEKDELLELNKVISKACDPDPRCRYATAAELHADLLKIQNRLGAPA